MAIAVVCRSCKKRFQVSDKFAGQKGPCPNCKAIIEIPKKEDEVVVHEPEAFGPKGKSGEAVLKPIFRQETKVSAPLVAGILAAVAVVFFAALVLRNQDVPLWMLGLGAVALGPPLAAGGYAFLRDDDLEPFRGADLWIRAGVCGLVYALLWGVVGYINYYLFEGDPFGLPLMVVIVPAMIVAGAGVAFVSLDLDFTIGMVHYVLYFGTTVLLRLTMGMAPIGPEEGVSTRAAATLIRELWQCAI